MGRAGLAAARVFAILIWTAGWFTVWGSGAILLRPFPRIRAGWRRFSVQRWARGVAATIGMQRVITGTPPAPPFLLVSNHLSYLDILLCDAAVPVVFVAKREMRSWPGIGILAHLTGTIWIDRNVRRDVVRTLLDIDAAIRRGDGVILFLEGTTSSGAGLLPIKPALLEWAARQRFPVHYAAVGYRTRRPGERPSAREALCWWGDVGFGRHALGVLQLRGFVAEISFGAEPVTAESRSELAEVLTRRIGALFRPVEG